MKSEGSLNSLLIRAYDMVRASKGRKPIRNRKLWINRQRPFKQWIKSMIPFLEKGWIPE